MKRIFILLAAFWLVGCASVTKVGPGETVVGSNVAVQLDSGWNQLAISTIPTATTWTAEGITIDTLHFFVAIKDGSNIAPTPKNSRPLTFKAGMQPHEIVALYQSMMGADGSAFSLVKLEPAEFLGGSGFRFEYDLIRKQDEVRMRGLAFGTVRNNELYVLNYCAPRLGFYPRYADQVEAIARRAKLKPS